MLKQIKRLSPHQNGKVFGVLMALSSLVFVVPMALAFSFLPMQNAHNGPPMALFLLFPVLYLFVGYVSVAISCALYNAIFKYIGGIEYEMTDGNT